jgi:DNA (cytosine-5)-methyltransferase 1
MLVSFHGAQDPDASGDVTHPCGTNQGQETCVAYSIHERLARDSPAEQNGSGISADVAFALDARGIPQSVSHASRVRRPTPVECERLQGFPDPYTLIPYRGKPAADGPRYRALGNSMAVPVMRWIGQRIKAVDLMPADRTA